MPKKNKISLSRLESFLKAQCDRLRTSMDAAEYKNYRFNWQSYKINRQVFGKKAPYAVCSLMYSE